MELHSHRSKKSQRELGLLLVLFALLLLVVAVVFNGKGPNESTHSSVPPRNLNIEKRIDQSLKKADARIRFNQEKLVLENEAAAPVGAVEPHSDIHVLQMKQESHGQEVLRQLEKSSNRAMTPDERIRRKQERDQWVRDYDERFEREFVQQFQDNARMQGYQIRLNENLDVTGFNMAPVEKPIRVPQSVPGTSK